VEQEALKFLQAEETAEKLVHTLKELHTEATSYSTATKELDVVRQGLLGLIESTEKVVNSSHEAIKILREIGAPEILGRLTEMETELSGELAAQSKNLNKLKTLVIVTLVSSVGAIIVGVVALLQ
jgi:hypothetical protein